MIRVMIELFGIIFVDDTEIVLRIYSIEKRNWQLVHYTSQDLLDNRREATISAYDIAEVIVFLFSQSYSQKVVEWKICARGITKATAAEIAHATGIKVEHLQRIREQELICKGLFSEFW